MNKSYKTIRFNEWLDTIRSITTFTIATGICMSCMKIISGIM